MPVYLDGVMLLNFLVDFLLLMGAARLCGFPARPGKCALAALLGAVYAGVCLLPGWYFLGNYLWRTVSLCTMAVIAFGCSRSALRRGLVFAFLSYALGGLAMSIGRGGVMDVMICAGVLFMLCAVGFRNRLGANAYLPVELTYGNTHLHLTALQDTGNTLRDPVTGGQVLVVEPSVAEKLTGLTPAQLRSPVESIGAIPGLRLIPFRSVGTNGGFLLALKLQNVKIGNWQGSTLVAFAPEGFGKEGAYQALTGGAA